MQGNPTALTSDSKDKLDECYSEEEKSVSLSWNESLALTALKKKNQLYSLIILNAEYESLL